MKILLLPFNLMIDFIKSIANPKTRRSSLILAGSILGSCLLCFGAFSIFGDSDPSSTPTPQLSNEDIIKDAVRGIQDSFDQTAAAIPTFTPPPTDTFTPPPTNTLSPTNTPAPTSTTAPLPTATAVIILPTQPSASYDSNGDGKVTCADFTTQAAAQQAYNAGYTNLDGNDNDGKACETLP